MATDNKIRVRFAPSPTGPLHIGGVRTALYNYLLARKHGGVNILRIEDTDQTRYVPGAEQYIIEALQWVGITFDEGPHIGGPHAPYRQSERKPMYRQYAEQLIANDWAYYAFDTEAELDDMRKRMEAGGMKSPQYNAVTREYMKNSIVLPKEEVEQRLASGQPYVIRFKIPRKEEVRFHDEIRGWVNVHSSQLDDKVLLKSDGMPTYHLANIVDDHLMEITHVIRGEEWLPSTPLHVLLYRAFGWEAPKFAHLPLLLKPDGNGKLSKRDGDQLGFPVFPLEWKNPETGEKASGYRESGYLPEAVVNFLALLGWNPGHDEEIMDMQRLIELFSLDRVGSSGVKFDYKKAQWFNQYYLRKHTDADFLPGIRKQMQAMGYADRADQYLLQVVHLMKDRVTFVHEFVTLCPYFFETPKTYDPDMVKQRWNADAATVVAAYADALQYQTDWSHKALEEAFNAAAAGKGLKSGKVMAGLRLAVTGLPFGPGVYDVMELIGKTESLARLQAVQKALALPA
jgi:glutamyl-tRNA synthetase